jgi:hypothetical protein
VNAHDHVNARDHVNENAHGRGDGVRDDHGDGGHDHGNVHGEGGDPVSGSQLNRFPMAYSGQPFRLVSRNRMFRT